MLSEVTDFCRLILFRHPELAPEDSNRAIGGGAAGLSRRGRETVLAWLDLLSTIEVDVVLSSDQPQCAEAAAGIAATKGVEVETDEALRDQDLGSWTGKDWQAIAAEDGGRVHDFFADFGEVAAPDGESLGQAVERFLNLWQERRQEYLGKTVVVVTSGAMVTGFVAALLGMRLSRAVCLNLPHGGVGLVDVYANGARITCWNPGAIGG